MTLSQGAISGFLGLGLDLGVVMSDQKVERRKHKRFRVTQVFAKIGPGFVRIGLLRDISMGGLAFQYIGEPQPPTILSELEIYSANCDLYLSGMPFKAISDVPFGSAMTRRCSVQFGELTETQISELESLIQNYAVSEP